ncbi:MAG TPA: hypothetical protein VLX29_05935 [Nitrospirota bacterium]|nr:hypothetical protein [Nitrospirota bacterium]
MIDLIHIVRRPVISSISHLVFLLTLVLATPCAADNLPETPQNQQAPETSEELKSAETSTKEFKRFELVFEPDAYYSDVDVIISLTKKPIPHIGELNEFEIYAELLSRAAIFPQFLVLEASINPLPYLGTYIRSHATQFYQDATLFNSSFNWIESVTAGFDEPYAFSILAGNVADFTIAGSNDTKGLGYSGYLVSYGNFNIKQNKLIQDDWWEFEWKMKGDRKSPVKKLNWSFRIGAKEHGNKNITDVLYVSFRRDRVDYKPEGYSLLNNSGFEYTYYMDRRTFSAVEHYFTVDKKWPLENRQIALALALGFEWQSAKKYTGPYATGSDSFTFIVRPNIQF